MKLFLEILVHTEIQSFSLESGYKVTCCIFPAVDVAAIALLWGVKLLKLLEKKFFS